MSLYRRKDPVYVMVPRKLLIAWISTSLVIFITVLGAYQYANYVDRESNKQWCSVITLFNQAYKETPPPTDLGKKIAAGMINLEKKFSCE